MISPYQLRLLGTFQLIRGGESAASFRSQKERALLAYLAVESNRIHSREALAALLWPELPGDIAHNNLRVTLHRLRQVLGDADSAQPLLEVSHEAIQINQTADLWIDVAAFQELLTRADQHSHEKLATCSGCMDWYTEATALYRGEFLQGVYPADSLPFSEWALLKREHLHSQALNALYHLAAYHQRRGELSLALGCARRQLELEPWREEAHCQVMIILALRGERSAALRQYERCRQVLWEELRVEPSGETHALYERILASRKRHRHNLSLQTTPFLGRKVELNQVGDYLANPDCRLLTILGPGGIGKSRLAFQVAEAQVYSYLQGVFLVQLAGVTKAGDMIRAIAAALELQFHPAGDANRQLIDFLRQKEMLLVLDNFEQLLALGDPLVARVLEDLLENAFGIRVLVTSRQRLNLSREWVFVLQGLSFPESVIDPEVERYESVQLFLQSASRADHSFQTAQGEELPVVHICQLLEGVPLAIELAAAWTRVMSPGQIAQEIVRDLDILASSCPDLPERQRSLRATFEHSYDLLAPEEQQALCRLSIFPVSFDRAAAEQVAGATLPVLTSLLDCSLLELLRTSHRGSHPRYQMHELIRQYSGEKLKQDPAQVEDAKECHRRYYMRFLNDRNQKVMGGKASYQAGQEVVDEIENVRLALEQAMDQGNIDELGGSYNILMFSYEIQGLFEEAERIFGMIRKRMEEIVPTSQLASEKAGYYLGRARMYHGWYCMHLARYDEAIELTQKGLAVCRQSGDLEGYGLGLNSLGVIAMDRGEYQQAKGFLQDALEVDSENGYTWAQAGALGNLGFLALMEGDPSLAVDYFHQGLDLHAPLNDEWAIAGDLDGLGDAALQQGNLVLAEQRFRQALEIRQKHGQRWRVALSLNRLGEVAYRRQHYAEARQNYQDSLAILQDFGERFYIASTLARYGEVCTALDENGQARESWQASLKLAKKIGAESIALRAVLGLAGLLVKEGEEARSIEILTAIIEHPSLEYEDKIKAARLLSEILGGQPPQVVKVVQENEKSKALDDLVRDVLRADR